MASDSVPNDPPLHFLFAMFQGGGNIPLILPIAGRLVAHGHKVRVLAGPGIRAGRLPVSDRFREGIAAAGATLVPFQEPEVHPLDAGPPLRGLVRCWLPRQLAGPTEPARTYRWCSAWATNVAAELRREPADVLAVDYFLPGALAAGEAADVPTAALVHGFYKHQPAPGLPPYGTGFMPARGPLGALRDALYKAGVRRVYRRDALPQLNRARQQLGLPPLPSSFEQYDRAERVLLLASAALDFPVRRLPPNVRYVGAPFDDADSAAWDAHWPADDPRPLVVVSLSTLQQGQGQAMQRILDAIAPLPVRALATLGPLDPAALKAPPNTVLERFVPHAAVLPRAAVMVTQCGMGGMTKALAHGVPLVCLPLVGDQPDNAARVVARGAGVRLAPDASPEKIRAAIQRVLAEPRFRAEAQRLAGVLADEDGAEQAAQELESLVQVRAGTH